MCSLQECFLWIACTIFGIFLDAHEGSPGPAVFPFVLHLDYTQRRSFPAFEDIQLVTPN